MTLLMEQPLYKNKCIKTIWSQKITFDPAQIKKVAYIVLHRQLRRFKQGWTTVQSGLRLISSQTQDLDITSVSLRTSVWTIYKMSIYICIIIVSQLRYATFVIYPERNILFQSRYSIYFDQYIVFSQFAHVIFVASCAVLYWFAHSTQIWIW